MEPSSGPPEEAARFDRVLVAVAAVALVLLAARVLLPLFAPLIFAAWTASILGPLAARVTRLARGRAAVGAGVSVLLVLSLFVPVGLVLVSLGTSVVAFVRQVSSSPAVHSALVSLVSSEGASETPWTSPERLVELARTHGMTAWQAARGVAGAGAWAVIVGLIYFITLFELLVSGPAMWRWAQEHLPLERRTMERLAGAFLETGRGLIVGAGLTALVQAVLATTAYAALGVPRAVVLGAITYVAAFVPAVGTAVVWGPVAVGLALQGEHTRAIILALVGALGVSSIDNLVRPLLQRWGGKLDLPAFLLLLAAFGGLSAFGPIGLVVGPLSLRMTREVLAIARERREARRTPEGADAGVEPPPAAP